MEEPLDIPPEPPRPNREYDPNNDPNYIPRGSNIQNRWKERWENENNYRNDRCYICDHNMVFKENGFPKKFDVLNEIFLETMNETAEQHFASCTLQSAGIRVLADMFNRDVVEKQNSRTSTVQPTDQRLKPNVFVVPNASDGVEIVPFERVTPLDMERHYLGCIQNPLVLQYNLMVKLGRKLEEMDEDECLVYEHGQKKTKTNEKEAVRYNYPAQNLYLNTQRMYMAAIKTLYEMRIKHRGNIYKKSKKDSGRRK